MNSITSSAADTRLDPWTTRIGTPLVIRRAYTSVVPIARVEDTARSSGKLPTLKVSRKIASRAAFPAS